MTNDRPIALTKNDQRLLDKALEASTEHLYGFGKPEAPSAAMPSEEDFTKLAVGWMAEGRYVASEVVAKRIYALFAPILAEKEREIAELKTAEGAAKAWCRAKDIEPMFHWDGRKTWQDVGLTPITLEEVKAALAEEEDDHRKTEARALAAEAALAAERERCAKIAEGQDGDGLHCRSLLEGQHAEYYDCGQIDASTSIAAAIRAQGE